MAHVVCLNFLTVATFSRCFCLRDFFFVFSADISCESPDSIRCSDAAGASCFAPRDACDDFDDCSVLSGEDESGSRCGYDSSGTRDDHNKNKNKDQVDSFSSSTEEIDSTATNDEGFSILLHVVLLFLLILAMKYFECAYPPAVFEFVTRMR